MLKKENKIIFSLNFVMKVKETPYRILLQIKLFKKMSIYHYYQILKNSHF